MLALYMFSACTLLFVCIMKADVMSHLTDKRFIWALIIIMVGDVLVALCAMYEKLKHFELVAATVLTLGVALWLFAERRHDPIITS